MWIEKKWVANLKIVLDMALPICVMVIALFSWLVYRNQLKIMEYDNSPQFKIDVSTEPVDNTYERYIQVTNLGKPIKAIIDTEAIMVVQVQDHDQNINIKLDGYFYQTDDMIAHGTSMTDILCKRGTNFSDSYIKSAMYEANQKLNEAFNERKIPIYEKVFYLVKIEYTDYKKKDIDKYYLVGDFQNQEIRKVDYDKFLNAEYSLDVGNYLNSPVDDKIMEILIKVLN